MKIQSTKQLVLSLTIILTVVVCILTLAADLIDHQGLEPVIAAVLFFGISYTFLYFILTRFIADKIKPVYKTIREMPVSSHKLEKKNARLSEVKKEVEKWEKGQLYEVERLKDLEKYRKDFVGNVSHELKTPIFNIQGYLSTLLEGGIDDPKINKLYLKRAEKNVDRMISIISDLESITKIESGEMKLRIEKFDLVKMVEEVFDLDQRIAAESDVTLEFYPKPDRPVYVQADRKGVFEILTNLIGNGIKYNRRNGFVRISFYDMEDHVMVEITDNGIGIDKKNLPRIFERFYRVDKSRSREQGGTGLGLSIVKHMIEAHDQSINVKSVLDEGTSFTFTLDKAK